MKKLAAADIAFARVNDWELLSKHAASAPDHGRHAERPGQHAGAGRRCAPAGARLRPDPGARRAHRNDAPGIFPK